MNEFEDIQRLIRLKRFEQPEEGFTDNFLREFHQRQRADMLKHSALELLWERTTTWWNNLFVPKWGVAAAGASVCAMSLWMWVRPADQGLGVVSSLPAINVKEFIPKMDLSDIPLARMAEHDGATLADMLLRKHLEIRPSLEGTVTPIPVGGWQAPSSKNILPIPPAELESIGNDGGR